MTRRTLALACTIFITGFTAPAWATPAPSGLDSTAAFHQPKEDLQVVDDRIELAQLLGNDARKKRGDRRDSRQDCRVDEGAAGQDKRECKEDRAVDRTADTDQGGQGDFDESAFREGCETMDGDYSTRDVDCTSSGCRTEYFCRFPDGTGRACDEQGDCRSYR